MPGGLHFRGQTAQPPDLDGPSEAGYLCGLFVFGWIFSSLPIFPEIVDNIKY